MEAKSFWPCSREPVIRPYPEADESSPHLPIHPVA